MPKWEITVNDNNYTGSGHDSASRSFYMAESQASDSQARTSSSI